jgi:hypothetical protein
MRPCLISEWRSQPIVASWPTCVWRGDGVRASRRWRAGGQRRPPHAAAATITRTPQTHAAVRVALHAEREGHVREAERVVEARRARERVLEVDEVLLRLGEDRLGRGRGRRRDEGRRHGGERERDDELHVNLRAERRSRLPPRSGLSVARCVRQRRLQPPVSARSVCTWRAAAACARRAVRSSSRRQKLIPAVTGNVRTSDRRRARGSRFFLQKTPARWRAGASLLPAYRCRGFAAVCCGSRRRRRCGSYGAGGKRKR